MDQPKTNPPEKRKKSKACCFIQVFILLFVLGALTVGLIYYFGTQKLHNDVPHALDQIFGTAPHKDLISKLSKKSHQHAIVWGANETGIFQFLEHYADQRASKGGLVVLKRVQNNLYETALKFIRYTKDYIQENINLQGQLEKVQWIFLVKNDEIPIQQIQRIRNKRPNDRVVVGVVHKPIATIKGFKKIAFPPVPISVVQQVISKDFQISPKTAEILTNYYGTIPAILTHLNQISFTNQKHLGQHYRNIKDLDKAELKTLQKLCAQGVAPLEGSRAILEQIGVVSYDKKVYWESRINRLNYELSTQTPCVDVTVSQELKVKIAQQRQQQSKDEIQRNNEEQVSQQVPAAPASPKKSKKSKTSAQTKTKTQPKPAQPQPQPQVQKPKKKASKSKSKSKKA